MSLIKNKIRIERLRKDMCKYLSDSFGGRGYDIYPNKILKDYKFFGFGDMTDEDIVIEHYNSGFIKYCSHYDFFQKNKDIVTTLLSEIIYDKNHSNSLENYELQLYRIWLIVLLLLREYKIQSISDFKNKTIDELENIIDELTLIQINKIKKDKWWKFLFQ